MAVKWCDFEIETGEILREREFTISISKDFLKAKKLESEFITQHILPNLYQQADVYFGKSNWYLTNFDFYITETEKVDEKEFHYFVITCCGKVPKKIEKADK